MAEVLVNLVEVLVCDGVNEGGNLASVDGPGEAREPAGQEPPPALICSEVRRAEKDLCDDGYK